MAAKAFLEQYLECTDSLPLDIQKIVSQYREMDYQVKDLLTQAQVVRKRSQSLVSVTEHINWLIQLQRVMTSLRDVGSDKLELTGHMLDTVEGYGQKLELVEKEVDNCRTRDDLSGAARNSLSHLYKASAISALSEFSEKKRNERHPKRSRGIVQEQIEEEIVSVPPSIVENDTKEPPVAMVTPTPPSSSSSSTVKPPKKKVKIKKRSSNVSSTTTVASKEAGPLLPVGVAIPQPDFNSEPIDPDEPTYCLCNQVSFGEMIGCDNDECPIEWFHFVCVNLTSKPKGKWYCPQCVKERAKHRTK